MGYPVDRRYGLTLVFADYSLLPDLLARVPRAPGLEVPGSWRQFLRENACNLNHTEEERIGDSGLIADGMAADAWRLARGLELVSKEGLTERGADLARLADTPLGDLTERDDQVLRVLLAEQLVNFYLSRGPSIARLLQEGARRLEGSESAQYCPGVLLGACAIGCFCWAPRGFAGNETSDGLLRSATRGHRPAGGRRMPVDGPADRADWGRIALLHAAASPCIRFMFSARHTRAHSPCAWSRPRTLKRRKPSACLIHPLGASDSHLRLAYCA